MKLDGYSSHRKSGGCIIYTKYRLKLFIIKNTNKSQAKILGVKLNALIAHRILLAKRNFSTKIKVCKENKVILLVRDFNHRNIDENLLDSDPCSKRLPDIIQDLFLTQHKKESTRGYIILNLVLRFNPCIVRNTCKWAIWHKQ